MVATTVLVAVSMTETKSELPREPLARIIHECEEIGRQKKPPLLQTC